MKQQWKKLGAICLIAMMAVTGLNGAEAGPSGGDRVDLGVRMAAVQQHSERKQPAEEGERVSMGQNLADERTALDYGWDRTAWSGAVHELTAVGAYGDVVEIEDGSLFTIAPGGREVVTSWLEGDRVYLLPNHGYLWGLIASSYDYCLQNIDSGQTVEVNLTAGPYADEVYSLQLSAIDDATGTLWLHNGMVLKVDPSDRYRIHFWEPSDYVILGHNDGWHRGSYPNIVVNVATLDSVRIYIPGAY